MTKLLYLEDMQALDADTRVEGVEERDGKTTVVLDQTIFYPQGGGQPYDQGRIESEKGSFRVDEVRFVDGIVCHIGRFEHGVFGSGDAVHLGVDGERRALHTRLHSAGHVVDMAVNRLGFPWIPGKGYHFPNGPYVEYAGTLEGKDRDALRGEIEKICGEIVAKDCPTSIRFMPREEMHTVCRFVPDYLPVGKPSRVVMYGDFGVPCGGTHVANLRDIGPITVRKVKQEGQNIRGAYSLRHS